MIPTLKNRSEFLNLRKSPRFTSDCFIMQGQVDTPSSTEKSDGLAVGYTVTKKIGNAVERNRIRRRLKHAMKHVGSDTIKGEKNSFSNINAKINIIAHRKSLNASFATLTSNITKGIDHVIAKGKTRCE